MTINLEHPAIFTDGNIVKLNEDLSGTKVEVVGHSMDFMRLIEEPIDLIPGAHDVDKRVLHLEPGDILLTFRDWTLSSGTDYYRIAIKNEQLFEFLTKLKEKRMEDKKQEECAKNSCCMGVNNPS